MRSQEKAVKAKAVGKHVVAGESVKRVQRVSAVVKHAVAGGSGKRMEVEAV